MSQPERAPDSQRERIKNILRSELDWPNWPEGLPRATVGEPELDAMVDALRRAREGDGYEGIANDLVRELTTARERIAELEGQGVAEPTQAEADVDRALAALTLEVPLSIVADLRTRVHTERVLHRQRAEQAEAREGTLREALGQACSRFEALIARGDFELTDEMTTERCVSAWRKLAPTADRSGS